MLVERITIVAEGSFGPQLEKQAVFGPVWAVRSAENQSAMKKLWAGSNYPGDHLTIFNGEEGTPEEVVLGILGAVDLHHPGWRMMEFVGAQPTTALADALREYGDGLIESTHTGFTYLR